MAERTVVIVGATGSIGGQTLDVLRKLKGFELVGFTYHRNESKAIEIKKIFPRARAVSTVDSLKRAVELVEELRPDVTVVAIPGFSGFEVSYHIIPFTKRLALANKESLVCGGRFIKERAKDSETEIIPIDSEHSATFQLLQGERTVEKIAITASGGALRDYPLEKLKNAKPEDVLKHPVWKMGAKVTVDSATMVNKALEVLEAMELFSLKREQVEVFVHREGKIHAMVFLKDGTVKIHASVPDMRIPIAYSLTYPERTYENPDFPDLSLLRFERPQRERYPLFFLVDEIHNSYALRTAYNAADEVAVEAFLEGKIKFTDIHKVVEKTLNRIDSAEPSSPEELKEIDKKSRRIAEEVIGCCLK